MTVEEDATLYQTVQEALAILREDPDPEDTALAFSRVAKRDQAVAANITTLGFVKALVEVAPPFALQAILEQAGVYAESYAEQYERHEATLTQV